MALPRDGLVLVYKHVLDDRSSDLYERFMRQAERYHYRDVADAAAEAILRWVESCEQPDTGRPPPLIHHASPDATIPDPQQLPRFVTPPPPGPDDDDP